MAPPQGATFIFGPWVYIANGSGGFDSHLTDFPTLKIATSEDLNKFTGSGDHDVMLLPDLAKEIEAKLKDNLSSTRTQIDLKPESTRIGTLLAQPIFGLRNSSSAYKQMIKSIYENSLDHLLRVKNHSVTASHPFSTYTQIQSSHLKTAWISSPMRWLRCNSNLAKAIPSQNYSTTCEK